MKISTIWYNTNLTLKTKNNKKVAQRNFEYILPYFYDEITDELKNWITETSRKFFDDLLNN